MSLRGHCGRKSILTRFASSSSWDYDQGMMQCWSEPRLLWHLYGSLILVSSGRAREQSPGLSVRFTGIDKRGLASYLISLYCAASVLTDDATASLENVEVANYHEYK
jgi:hypothetical protein